MKQFYREKDITKQKRGVTISTTNPIIIINQHHHPTTMPPSSPTKSSTKERPSPISKKKNYDKKESPTSKTLAIVGGAAAVNKNAADEISKMDVDENPSSTTDAPLVENTVDDKTDDVTAVEKTTKVEKNSDRATEAATPPTTTEATDDAPDDEMAIDTETPPVEVDTTNKTDKTILPPHSCSQRQALTLSHDNLDGPYTFPGEFQADLTDGESTATMPFKKLPKGAKSNEKEEEEDVESSKNEDLHC
jgi:hypothetical protein